MSDSSNLLRIAPVSILDVMSEEDIRTGIPMTQHQAEKVLLFLQTGEIPNFNHMNDNDGVNDSSAAVIERRLSLKSVMPVDYFHKLGFFSSSQSSRSSF